MRIVSILCLFQVLAISGGAGEAQSGELGFGAASFGNGASVRIATRAEPPKDLSGVGVVNGYAVDKSALHRSLIDHAHSTYFGYDIYVEPLENKKKCRVTISALSSVGLDHRAGNTGHSSASAGAGGAASVKVPASYRCIALPKYPEPQIVNPGDTLALDLLVSPDGRERITDYITVVISAVEPFSKGPPVRDFALEDVALHIQDPSLSLNGATSTELGQAGEFVGHLFWFFVPGKGRFIVSPAPNAGRGFERIGMIRGTALLIRCEGTDYEIRSRTTILGSESGQSWNVYVLHDSSFEPKSGVCGSAMRLEQLFLAR